jgi:hypothetical protein
MARRLKPGLHLFKLRDHLRSDTIGSQARSLLVAKRKLGRSL